MNARKNNVSKNNVSKNNAGKNIKNFFSNLIKLEKYSGFWCFLILYLFAVFVTWLIFHFINVNNRLISLLAENLTPNFTTLLFTVSVAWLAIKLWCKKELGIDDLLNNNIFKFFYGTTVCGIISMLAIRTGALTVITAIDGQLYNKLNSINHNFNFKSNKELWLYFIIWYIETGLIMLLILKAPFITKFREKKYSYIFYVFFSAIYTILLWGANALK